MNFLTPETVIKRSEQTASRQFEGNMLAITSGDSMLHRFNDVGSFIWRCLEDGPRTVDELFKEIEVRFAGFERERDRNDVLRFIDDMRNKKLVIVLDPHE